VFDQTEESAVGIENRVINDVAIIAEKGTGSIPRLLISTTSTLSIKSTSTARASKSTQHHDLIVYDIENRRVESRIPLFGRTRALSLSKDKSELVIGYAKNPPQLWEITLGKILELTPQHTYYYTTRTKPPKERDGKYWWGSPRGRSFFCASGTSDNLVICWDYNCGVSELVKSRRCYSVLTFFFVHS